MFSKLTTGVKTWQIYCTTQTANSKISKLVGKKMKVISKARQIEQSHCSSYYTRWWRWHFGRNVKEFILLAYLSSFMDCCILRRSIPLYGRGKIFKEKHSLWCGQNSLISLTTVSLEIPPLQTVGVPPPSETMSHRWILAGSTGRGTAGTEDWMSKRRVAIWTALVSILWLLFLVH